MEHNNNSVCKTIVRVATNYLYLVLQCHIVTQCAGFQMQSQELKFIIELNWMEWTVLSTNLIVYKYTHYNIIYLL